MSTILYLSSPLALDMGRVSQVRSLAPNFTVVALKMWAYRRQNSQNCQFLVEFGQKWGIPR